MTSEPERPRASAPARDRATPFCVVSTNAACSPSTRAERQSLAATVRVSLALTLTLSLSLAGSVIAPAARAVAQEIVKYRTADGQIGFTTDPATVPPGARILTRDARPKPAAEPQRVEAPRPARRAKTRARPAPNAPSSGKSTAEKYRRMQAKVASELEAAERAWRSTPCETKTRYQCTSDFYGRTCRDVTVRDCSARQRKRAALDALVEKAPAKLDEITNDCMADEHCSVNDILDDKNAFSYTPPDDSPPGTSREDKDPDFDAVDDKSFDETTDRDAFDETTDRKAFDEATDDDAFDETDYGEASDDDE